MNTARENFYESSQKLFARAVELMPGGVNSPVRAFRAVGGTPRFIKYASGATMTDVDGHTYIDYVGSWGPMILGHADAQVVAALTEAVSRGTSYGAPTELEVELAEEIIEAVPSIEMVRMVNSGTEATMSAIRLARGVTGRNKLIKFEGCYHGHGDSLLVKAGSGVAVDKFPNEPIAIDAQYQIGYIWFAASQLGTNDAAAADNAKTAFQDFLFHYPKSEKAAQARKNLDILEHKQTTNSFKVAKFYDKQKYYRAAVIYYNEVIRQQPGSEESNEAKKRIDQLRAKLGDAALQPAIQVSQNAKKKPEGHVDRTAGNGPARPGAPNNEAPLPASDGDSSLPPPASLAPDTTTAPEPLLPLPGASTSTSSGPSNAPAVSSSPEESALPAP